MEHRHVTHKVTSAKVTAHEVKPHKLSELNAAFDVIDHLLQGVYLIPAKAKELPENGK